jgi:hypothetical protein
MGRGPFGGSKNNQPHLTRCANLSGQHWSIMADGEAVRLTTQFRGPGMCLDIFNGGPNNNQPHLAKCSNLTGQLWTLTKTDKPTRLLERRAYRSGKDSVDHGRNGHDDHANAVCGGPSSANSSTASMPFDRRSVAIA